MARTEQFEQTASKLVTKLCQSDDHQIEFFPPSQREAKAVMSICLSKIDQMKEEENIGPDESSDNPNYELALITQYIENAKKYGLLTEVVWSALELVKNDPEINPVDALADACSSWDI
jgi:hypothetical protein